MWYAVLFISLLCTDGQGVLLNRFPHNDEAECNKTLERVSKGIADAEIIGSCIYIPEHRAL